MINSPETFSTNDTALAAWLISQEFELLSMDNSQPNSVVFLFPNNDEKINKAVSQFQLGTAKGNVISFYRAYRYLIDEIKKF